MDSSTAEDAGELLDEQTQVQGEGKGEERLSKQRARPRQWLKGLNLHDRWRQEQAGCALAEA